MPGHAVILPIIPYGKLVAGAAVVVLLAGTHWKAYTVGRNGERAIAVALQLKQTADLANFNEQQRLLERGWQAKTTKAQNDRTVKIQTSQPVISAVRTELAGLRNTIYALNSDASGQSPSACKTAAITARAVFEQCAQRYTDLASKADGHDADTVMFEQSWPK